MAEAINGDLMSPDLQAALLCEDVRTEIAGQQSLIGVLSAIPAPALPVRIMKLCLWTRWGNGVGRFNQRSLILDGDEEVIAKAEVTFALKELNSHATNVHFFGGLQFPKYGVYHVEIHLDEDLRQRFPLAVVQIKQNPHGS